MVFNKWHVLNYIFLHKKNPSGEFKMLAVIYRQHANFSSHFLKADELLVITVLPRPTHIINRHNCINWWKIQNAEQGCRSVVVCCLGLGWSSPGHKAIIIWSSSFVIVFKKCTPSFSNITWHKRLLQYSMDLVSVHWLPFSIFMDLLLAARRCKYIHCIRFPLCHNGNTPVACSVYGNYVLRQSRLTTISVRWSHLLDHWRWSLVRNALYMTQCSSSRTSPRGDRSVLWCWMEMGLMCHSLQTFVTF